MAPAAAAACVAVASSTAAELSRPSRPIGLYTAAAASWCLELLCIGQVSQLFGLTRSLTAA